MLSDTKIRNCLKNNQLHSKCRKLHPLKSAFKPPLGTSKNPFQCILRGVFVCADTKLILYLLPGGARSHLIWFYAKVGLTGLSSPEIGLPIVEQ